MTCLARNTSIKKHTVGKSLEVQWLGLCASTSTSLGSIPGQRTKISQVEWCGKQNKMNKKQKQKKKNRVVSLRGLMESISGRLELFMKTFHNKHGCQGNEPMWPQVGNLLPKLQLLFHFC